MSLHVLMYHRARAGMHGNSAETLDRHFAYLAAHVRCVLPGDSLDPRVRNVCVSFDDAYYDFLAVVFPLLQKHGLRALLAVPTGLIRDAVTTSHGERLTVSSADAMNHVESGGLCTWPELRALHQSGIVMMASHGDRHIRIDQPGVDFAAEILQPKVTLQERLGASVHSFVYPYGRFNAEAHAIARSHYRYVFRIGQASNRSWAGSPLYRIAADEKPDLAAMFTPTKRMRQWFKGRWNHARGV
jgi:peptidoglycan/xylan/chitin deacetylase (PgdA/CDA1 family)